MEPMEVDVDIDTGAMELKNPEKYILAEIENKKFNFRKACFSSGTITYICKFWEA